MIISYIQTSFRLHDEQSRQWGKLKKQRSGSGGSEGIDIAAVVAYMCMVYSYKPCDVLAMSYRHFALLAGHIDRNERRRAYYTALAFNSPKDLALKDDADVVSVDFNAEELLSACNDV